MTPHRPGSQAPTSTYRVQFTESFDFAAATELADYLADLGAGALYASPLLTASPGSTHGYDVVDPTQTSTVLGGDAGRRALAARLRELGLRLVVDIVPNHMGVADPPANPWWWDVLRYGPDSAYAQHFDIDWSRGRLLIPVLADDGDGGAAARRELAVTGGELRYAEHRYPLAPGTEDGTPDEVHGRQHYELVSWRRGAGELTYRRFFDVDTLAAVRVEDPAVFADTHAEILRWVAAGEVSGIRVDHPDGLTDPGEYLRRLRSAIGDSWLLAEKILAAGEPLPQSWPVDGTTGYEALAVVGGVFVDPAGGDEFTDLATELCGEQDLAEVEQASKALVADSILRAEVLRIAGLLTDVEPGLAERAVGALLTAFPVYRSYLPEGADALSWAAESVAATSPELAAVVGEIAATMTKDPHGELAYRVQQTSGMVMAKGVEDTAFYRYNRFVALNEVGGDPDRFGVSTVDFHAAQAERASAWPYTMTTLSTHDTKRAEDVRARLAVLAELPGEFAAAVRRWSARAGLPEPSFDMLAWQTLVGAWPITPRRLGDYLLKASKEAKLATSWSAPDAEFDAAVAAWPGRVLDDPELRADLESFVDTIRMAGWSNSLGQKLLQLAGPGVPDVYQGTELWDYSLVDPDNRRPVDFDMRRELLARIDGGWLPEVAEDGAAKLLLVSRVLRARRHHPELFTGYRALHAEGPAAEHAVSFCRGRRQDLVAVATRLPVGLDRRGGWGDTVLPLPGGWGEWTDMLTGHSTSDTAPRLADLLGVYPVALLARLRP